MRVLVHVDARGFQVALQVRFVQHKLLVACDAENAHAPATMRGTPSGSTRNATKKSPCASSPLPSNPTRVTSTKTLDSNVEMMRALCSSDLPSSYDQSFSSSWRRSRYAFIVFHSRGEPAQRRGVNEKDGEPSAFVFLAQQYPWCVIKSSRAYLGSERLEPYVFPVFALEELFLLCRFELRQVVEKGDAVFFQEPPMERSKKKRGRTVRDPGWAWATKVHASSNKKCSPPRICIGKGERRKIWI